MTETIKRLRDYIELAQNGKLDLGRLDSDYCYGYIDGLKEALYIIEEDNYEQYKQQ